VQIFMENLDLQCQLTPPSYATDLVNQLTMANVNPLYGGAVYVVDALEVKS
jgi:hypothetical protein